MPLIDDTRLSVPGDRLEPPLACVMMVAGGNFSHRSEVPAMKRYLVLLFALLFAIGALAQMPSFEEVDTNADGVIDREEAAAVEGLDFDAADTNMDGVIDRQEYEAARQEQE